jgi:hypothetical protein
MLHSPTTLAATIAVVVAVIAYVMILRCMNRASQAEARRREYAARHRIERLRARDA